MKSTLPGYSLEEALRSIPSVSIAMDPKDLLAPGGIYYSSEQVLERPASIELMHPDGSKGFQINAGIRIHGYTSRLHSFTPKHSFRVTFKSQYGPSKLEHRLFGDDDVERFDQIVLRGMSTDSWPVMDGWDGPEPGTRRWFRERSLYLREQWMKDSQLDMGQLAPHAFYVHVYLNGLYWGVYHLTERPTDSFHAEHQGGEREEFDVLKDFAEVQSGNGQAWAAMMSLASGGLGSQAAYERIQGNNPDGTRNPAFPKYVDVDNLIDYMILHIYASADDWPNHNWWGGRRRGDASEGFKFFAWDQEITHMSLDYVHSSWGPRYEEAGAPGSPSFLYAQMKANPAFKVRFGDRVQKHLFGSGALTPEASAARLERRAAEIDQAIVAESARWGDARRAVPFKREVEWLGEIERLTTDYWPKLHPIAVQRFQRVGLYPDVVAPSFSQEGGRIPPGFGLRLSAPAGKIYYTLDGTDPRTASGAVSPAALTATLDPVGLAGTTRVKARAQVGAKWSALAEAFFHIDVPLRITEIQYHPGAPAVGSTHADEDFEFLEIENVGPESIDLAGVRLVGAVRFDFSLGVVLSLAPGKACVVVRSYDAFVERYGARGISIVGEYSGELSNLSERIILEGPLGEPIHDFRYSDRWYPETDGGGPSLVIRDPHGDLSSWNFAESWRVSRQPRGSPGIDEEAPPPGGRRRGGDFNSDAALQLSDAVGLLGYLFIDAAAGLPCEGEIEGAGNLALLDSNGDGQVDLTDAVYVLGFLFLGGPQPVQGTACVTIPGCAESCSQ